MFIMFSKFGGTQLVIRSESMVKGKEGTRVHEKLKNNTLVILYIS